jgi:hypothetical protein
MEGCAETGSTGRIIEGLWSMDNRGKLTQLNGDFSGAARFYTEAYNNASVDVPNRRKKMISRPLISCILKSRQPNFEFAESLAKGAVLRNPTLFALHSYAEACLRRMHSDIGLSEARKDKLWDTYLEMETQIKNNPQGQSMYFAIASLSYELNDEYDEALSLAKQAASSERLEDKFQVWHLQLLIGGDENFGDVANQVTNEVKKVHSRARDELLAPTLSYAIKALRASDKIHEAKSLFNSYSPNLSEQQSRRIGKLLAADADVSAMKVAEHVMVE